MDELITQIDKSGWIRKGGLKIPDDVLESVRSPTEWLLNLKPIQFGLDTMPTIKQLIDFIPKDELARITQEASVELLASAYGVNKAVNSTRYKGDKLAARGQELTAKVKVSKKTVEIGEKGTFASQTYFTPQIIGDIAEREEYGGVIGDSPEERFRALHQENHTWLESIFDNAKKSWDDATAEVKRQFSRLMRKLSQVLGFKKKSNRSRPQYEKPAEPQEKFKMQFSKVSPSMSAVGTVGAIIPTTGIGIIGIINSITSSLLSTFILKAVEIPIGAFTALTQTTTAVIMKVLNMPGIEAIRYSIGGVLRGISNNLPLVWNNTGMFAGAWSLLTTYAPYIVAAAVLIILAIKLLQDTKIGDWVAIAGYSEEFAIPDLTFAQLTGNDQEKLADLLNLRDELSEKSGKSFNKIYGFSFDSFKRTKQEQAFNLSELVAVPIDKNESKILWLPISQLEFLGD